MSSKTLMSAALMVAMTAGTVVAQAPVNAVYSRTFVDASTLDNAFVVGGSRFYTIDAGADSYQNDVYERPVAAGFDLIGQQYAANEYLAYIDITQARVGFDNRFMYVAIDLAGLDKRTQDGVNTIEGLQGRYGFRFGTDADGRNSYYVMVDQPQSAALPNTRWTRAKTEAFRDTDQDVGGRGGPIHGEAGPSGISVTKVDNILEEQGLNGWDQAVIQSDGLTVAGLRPALWQRISPTDNTVVEIALEYGLLGLTRATVEASAYLHFEAQLGDLADPGMGLWNDQFTGIEAGSPNRGIGTDNEFGTQGLGSISSVDTLRGALVVVPPPPPVCPADVGVAGGAAGADGILDSNDLIVFIGWFFANDARADIGTAGGATGSDGQFDNNDFIVFIGQFFTGC